MRLKAAVDQARAANMPLDNIERAIQRTADKNQMALDEIRIEALGPGGTAIVIDAITDNRNRTIAELKTLLLSHGAKIVAEGSLNWMLRGEPVEVTEEHRRSIMVLLETLDDLDDVQTTTTNIKNL